MTSLPYFTQGKENSKSPFIRQVRGAIGKPSSFIKVLILVIPASALLLWLYVISVHRIRSVQDVRKVLWTMSRPVSAMDGSGRCRQANSTHLQCLPNVFMIGASKCGTTSIVNDLSLQSRVKLVSRRINPTDRHREIHRFDRNTYPYSNHYLELADEWASSPLVPDREVSVIHYTPHYLYAPSVPYDMRKFYPHSHKDGGAQLKFIISLRDPVERALSSYWFANSHLFADRRKGWEQGDVGSIEEFLRLAEKEMEWRKKFDLCMNLQKGKSSFESLRICFGVKFRSPSLGAMHLDKGIYVSQLTRWLENFPNASFYMTSLERYAADPVTEITRISSFLGIPLPPPQRHARSNAALLGNSNHLKREQPLPLSAMHSLALYYRPYTEQLRSLLSQKFPGAESLVDDWPSFRPSLRKTA